ncbi:DUF1905 domain-containing protein [Dactylosporangium sp. NPDC051541]|uniref:DUF1905 domain-containing protein n=1 Tax=Dactylosporangium sp. NPDC051541 TaxID=3363977 RepID=UPI0037AB755E
MDLSFSGEVWHWRGPAPHHFVTVPADDCVAIADAARMVSYGWGMIPATVTVGASTWTTSLFAKDGGYIVPLKLAVRRKEQIDVGDIVQVRLVIG